MENAGQKLISVAVPVFNEQDNIDALYREVVRYLEPQEFEVLGAQARQMGFTQVASGPFVRSSYHARDMVNLQSPTEPGGHPERGEGSRGE